MLEPIDPEARADLVQRVVHPVAKLAEPHE
jgi:hypothetical protein